MMRFIVLVGILANTGCHEFDLNELPNINEHESSFTLDSNGGAMGSLHLYPGNQNQEGQLQYHDLMHSSEPDSQGRAVNPLSNIDPGHSSEYWTPQSPYTLSYPSERLYQTYQSGAPHSFAAESSMTQSDDYQHQPSSSFIPHHEGASTSIHHKNVNVQADGIPYGGSWPIFESSPSIVRNLPHSTQEDLISHSMPPQYWIFDQTAFQLIDFKEPDKWYMEAMAGWIRYIACFPNPLTIGEDQLRIIARYLHRKRLLYQPHVPPSLDQLDPKDRKNWIQKVRRTYKQRRLSFVLRNRQIWLQFFTRRSGHVADYVVSEAKPEFKKVFPVYLFFVEMINGIIPRPKILSEQDRIQEACEAFRSLASDYNTQQLKDSNLGRSMESSLRQRLGYRRYQPTIWHFLNFWIEKHREPLNKYKAVVKEFFDDIFILCAVKLTERLAAAAVNQNP